MPFWGTPILGSNRGSYCATIYKGVSMVFGWFGRYVKKGSKRGSKSGSIMPYLVIFGYPYFWGRIEGRIVLLFIRACLWFLGGFGGM